MHKVYQDQTRDDINELLAPFVKVAEAQSPIMVGS